MIYSGLIFYIINTWHFNRGMYTFYITSHKTSNHMTVGADTALAEELNSF